MFRQIFFDVILTMVLGGVASGPALLREQEIALTNEVPEYDFHFITRSQWDAREPTDETPLDIPVPYVVLHHSYIPGVCNTTQQCSRAMRSMQNYHMDDRKWFDIGYNFAIGGDGAAYEGRSWTSLGAHARGANKVSIGICLIGDWRYTLPPSEMLATTQALIAAGVARGVISKDYRIIGHRQAVATECPGDALFTEISTWPQFSPHPASPAEPLDYNNYLKDFNTNTKNHKD